jgi:hypothetical protein
VVSYPYSVSPPTFTLAGGADLVSSLPRKLIWIRKVFEVGRDQLPERGVHLSLSSRARDAP